MQLKYMVAVAHCGCGCSMSSQAAFDMVMSLATHEDHIYLISVIDELEGSNVGVDDGSYQYYMSKYHEQRRAAVQALLDGFSAKLSEQGFKHTVILAEGSGADTIVHQAKEKAVDLLLTGRRDNMSALNRLVIGSTSLKIARSASCSVLIVKPVETSGCVGPKKYFVAVDESDSSLRAFSTCATFSKRNEDQIIVGTTYKESKKPEETEKRKQKADELLRSYKAKCADLEVKCETVVRCGKDAREMVCDMAEKAGADVLVVGSRGLGLLQRMLLGSVSSYCVEYAHCDVLVGR